MKNDLYSNVIKLIEVCTPDSLNIADSILECNSEKIASFEVLKDFFLKTPKSKYNQDFFKNLASLKTKVIQDLTKK